MPIVSKSYTSQTLTRRSMFAQFLFMQSIAVPLNPHTVSHHNIVTVNILFVLLKSVICR